MTLDERIARLWFQGLNTAEISRELHFDEHVVYNRLVHARRKYEALRKELRRVDG